MSVVRVEHVSRDYRLGDQLVRAVNDISLSVEAGVFLAISGPSGSGKTTLLNLIGCIDRPTQGNIYIDDRPVAGMTDNQLAALRLRSIGFIFQTFNLLPVLSAAENVEYPLLQRPEMTAGERKERVGHFLNVVGLADRMNNRPNQLSGGQRQRVAIARALAGSPSIILADEPTANLDKKTGVGILRLMKKINQKMNTTFIFSTHDRRVVDMADRLVQMEDGRIQALGVRREGEWLLAPERHADEDDKGDDK
ncbi:MAG: ABC transporter ATP-binding protein [Rhodocyclaceae bacterium]|jgi:putative ABC transport system ATP-binding protein|nr:ABC transporter ATP-binding protein [Rhodocyclaceae bacterium]MBK6555629.1 ABC transporter ATP-binding protein [Rhodocyclaceae bacterium]MBK6676465.1 ABC transporter ATP-binding protein [Rhodocyclaceae bacterium]MBK9312519.1 ABC transporter ATP-binding protein [Rhodocyclaceae bacterium]MBK9953912.1 ABC transporter ATP-binding protein [Rhodocyclaceae bacterium]